MGASQIKSDEVVVFFPTYAYLDAQGTNWILPIHGLIFEPQEDSVKRALLIAGVRKQLKVEQGTPEANRLAERMRLFLVDNERGKQISIRIGSEVYQAGTSGANGHFQAELRLAVGDVKRLPGNPEANSRWITFRAATREGDRRRFDGRAQLIGQTGLSIVSDIDDTIKHSQVTDRKALMRNTFLKEYQAVPGMAELYRVAAERGAAFHYVSGSPWQLYRPLEELRGAAGFPAGSFHLKSFRLKDSSALALWKSQEATKLAAMGPILERFPKRKFILIGDSGEQDPEIYAKIAREHPEQIVAVFIRNLGDQAAGNERFRTAFEGIERQRWELFGHPEELRERVVELAETHCSTVSPQGILE
ncbi:MAG: DUF2183 domain-containing protein [Pirellulales bacterium]|nr:DUF2183 domain-containing protein [Pirellulales bacterium]